jgi:ElaB/YqjD/DUF883 family membrane-anchored ribosome-binding protein
VNENHRETHQKMDDTQAQHFAKLQLLEEQIAEMIESAKAKVQSTLGSAESSMYSIPNATDIRTHIGRHPWWWLGGALAAGFVAGGLHQRGKPDLQTPPLSQHNFGSIDNTNTSAAVEGRDPDASLTALSTSYEPGSSQTTASHAGSLALNATVRIIEEVISRSVPIIIAYLINKHAERSQ